MILIFDIGKTNKKAFIFGADYRIVYENTTVLPETTDDDGFACENLDLLTAWLLNEFNTILKNPDFDIGAVNFSAYGASFVLIGENGLPITPLYNYLKPFDEKLKAQFYKKYGGENFVAQQTASPVLGNLNSGMQLYSLKKMKPDLFSKIKYALHLPQYLSYLLTQQFYSDMTSIGCHTNLWNFEKNKYHTWVSTEGIEKKLAPVLASDTTFEVIRNDKKLKVGIGLHDSSAALIPYLLKFKDEPFILISTGTWCISLNAFNHSPLTNAELENDCLCYISYLGKPIKAARYFGGNEHEQGVKKLAEKYGVSLDAHQSVKFDAKIIESLQSGKTLDNFNEAYHALMLVIVKKQVASTQLGLKNSVIQQIFVDGGFSKNNIYMQLLARAFPEIKVFKSEVSEATALGAALAIHSGALSVDSYKLTVIEQTIN